MRRYRVGHSQGRMAKRKPARKPRRTASAQATTISVYVEGPEQKARILAAVELVRRRVGVPVTLSGWLGSVVMKAVEDEERLAGEG